MDSNGYGGQRSEFIRLGAMAMEGVVGGVWRWAGAVCGCVLRGEEERVGGRRSTVQFGGLERPCNKVVR